MIDMTQTTAPKSDQMNADDLIGGKSITIKITKVNLLGGDQPVSLNFEGDNGKPYKPGKSMRRVLVQMWGPDGNAYVGRSLTLYRDDKVQFGGFEVGGIRISHMSHIDGEKTMALTASKTKRAAFTVKPLRVVADIDPSIKQAGDNAAANGEAAYTAWKDSLAQDVKETIKPYHGAWAKQAKSVSTPAVTDEPLI